METILLGAVLCALLVLIVLLIQLQRALGSRRKSGPNRPGKRRTGSETAWIRR